MADPLKGIAINIGGKNRTLSFPHSSLRVAQKKLRGYDMEIVLRNLGQDMDALCELAAAGLLTDKNDRVTPDKVVAWLDSEPTKTMELAVAVVTAYTESYQRMTKPEDLTPGEENPPPAPPPAAE